VITKDKELRLLKYNFPDSLKFDEATGRYVSETPEYVVQDVRFNVEQDNYMWYLRNSLVLPDVRLSQLQQSAQKEAEANGSKNVKKKAGFFAFFKNLFKKKEKEEIDTDEHTQPKASDDFDYVENDSIQQHQKDSIRLHNLPRKRDCLKRKRKTRLHWTMPFQRKNQKRKKEKRNPILMPTQNPRRTPVKEDAEEEEDVESF
jgi:hypothetical protein